MTQYNYDDYINREQISWDQIFDDLKQHDVRPCKIAELIDIPGSSLQRIMQGIEPRFSIGVSILKLHSRYCTT